MYDSTEIEKLIQSCLGEIEKAKSKKYDADSADKTAALCLEVQLKLSYFMEGLELESRNFKNDIARIEAEKYFEHKLSNNDKKMTETSLVQAIAKDPDVITAKQNFAEAEVKIKRFNYILNTLKDAHIYFRTLGKNNSVKWND